MNLLTPAQLLNGLPSPGKPKGGKKSNQKNNNNGKPKKHEKTNNGKTNKQSSTTTTNNNNNNKKNISLKELRAQRAKKSADNTKSDDNDNKTVNKDKDQQNKTKKRRSGVKRYRSSNFFLSFPGSSGDISSPIRASPPPILSQEFKNIGKFENSKDHWTTK